MHELDLIEKALIKIAPGKMAVEKFRSAFRKVKIFRWDDDNHTAFSLPGLFGILAGGDIVFTNYNFNQNDDLYATHGIIHEFGHVWDYRMNYELSEGLIWALGTVSCDDDGNNCNWYQYKAQIDENSLEIIYPEARPDISKICPKHSPDPYSQDKECRDWPYSATRGGAPQFTPSGAEDWAQSFPGYVYPDYFASRSYNGVQPGTIRYNYVEEAINAVH